ncbi:MAG: type I secretion C-terminal target domain-containing protein [Alphaproteobacteria bacterium]
MTIQDIEQQLINASLQGELDTINTIMLSLNESQVAQISSFVYGEVLSNISVLSYVGANPAGTIRIVMETASSYITSFAVEHVLQNMAWNDNLEGLDAVLDNLSAEHLLPDYQGGINSFTAAEVLGALVSNAQYASMFGDVSGHNVAIRDFMEVLGDHVDSYAVGRALVDLAWNDNLEGLDAVLDNLSAEHLLPDYQGGINFSDASDVLNALVSNAQYAGWYGGDVSGHNVAIRDFMEVLGDHVDSYAVGRALVDLAWNDNLEGLDAVLDNLSADHLLPDYQGGINSFAAAEVLGALVSNAQYAGWYGGDVSGHNVAIRDFMEVLGDHVDSYAVGRALVDLAWNDNLEGLDVVLDNLSAEHLLPDYQGGIYFSDASEVLNALVSNAQYAGWYGGDVSGHNVAIRDFMEVLGDHVDSYAVGRALVDLAGHYNSEGLDAVLDNLSADHLLPDYQGGISSFAASTVLTSMTSLVLWNYVDADIMALHSESIRGFMEVLGDRVETHTIENALQNISQSSHFEGVDAIVSNLSSEQLDVAVEVLDDRFSIFTEGNDYVYNHGNSVSVHGLDGNDTILGSSNDTQIFGGNGNDRLYDYRGGDDVLHGGNGNDFLDGGAGNDVLYGGDGSDILSGRGGADIFEFRQGDTGVDTIYYADAREGDRLDISDFLDQFDPLQDAIDDFVILSDNGFSTTVSIDVDGQGVGEAATIATLYGSTGVEVEGIIDLSSIGIV